MEVVHRPALHRHPDSYPGVRLDNGVSLRSSSGMMTEEKVRPQNLQAEAALLGSLLIDPSWLIRIRGVLRWTDFYREKNGWIYHAICSLHDRKEPVDFLTVCDELEKKGQLGDVGGPAYITELMGKSPVSLHAEHYAKLVSNAANNRRLIDAASQIVSLAYRNEDDVEAYAASVSILRSLDFSGRTLDRAGGKDLSDEILKDLIQAQAERERRKELEYDATWPWEAMNRMARWRIAQPVVLIAEGGAGKTTFCTAVGIHNAINGGRIFYAATEDEPSLLRKRILASLTGVPFKEIETAEYNQKDMISPTVFGVHIDIPARILRSTQSIKTWRGEIHIVPATGKTISEIVYDLCRLETEVGEPDGVILDWFLDHKRRPGDEFVTGLLADILDLKVYASDHRTRLLVATQTGKASNKGRLTSFDAFYTSGWNHYAKLAVTLQRERELVNGEAIGPFKPQITVSISKANLDKTGSFVLSMKGESFQIYEPEKIQLGYAYDD